MVVGLTGNIGSGKSIVAKIFSILGVPVYDADSNAKKFLDYPEVRSLMLHAGFQLPVSSFQPLSALDRKKLAEIVFTDRDKLNKLNKIIHPFVINDFNNWVKRLSDYKINRLYDKSEESDKFEKSDNYVILEAAILFESGYNSVADKIIVVTCPEELRIKRIIDRDNTTEPQVRQRMNNQWTEKQKANLADFTIINDDHQFITPRILEIHKVLKEITSS